MSRFDPTEDDDLVVTTKWDSHLLWRMLSWARPHARQFAWSAAILIALFAVQLAGPYLWRLALDGPVRAVLAGDTARNAALNHLYGLVAAFGGLVVVQSFLSYFEVAQLARTGQMVVHDLRAQLFAHIERLDLSFFDSRPTGSLVTRVTSDIENLSELYTSGLVVLFFDVIKIVALVGILFWINLELALVVSALTPILVLVSLAFRGGARNGYRLVRSRLARLNGYLQEVLSGIRVVQVFHRERLVSKRFAKLLEPYLQANLSTLKLFALFFPAITLTVYLIQTTALRVGGLQIAEGALEIGVFFQFWFYLTLLVDPIRELGERYNVLQAAFASAERVFQILDTEPKIAAPLKHAQGATATSRTPANDLVRFENVSFQYVANTPVLDRVSFEIPAGQTVAIVGPTGAGKSTIVNLVQRFNDPSAGRVMFDGVDLRELDPRKLRASCGLVLQDEFLFEGTVRENLVMGRAEVDEASLARALQMSCASDLIERLPLGLDEILHERGAQLSTGERQLLSMARALAGDPRLVILDEATASVDSGTEARIEEATRNLLAGRSALVIAHRLSTIQRADRILVMHHGSIREQGTHAELLELDGLYARLYDLQFMAGEPHS